MSVTISMSEKPGKPAICGSDFSLEMRERN